mgnify:CR=1 FL=1
MNTTGIVKSSFSRTCRRSFCDFTFLVLSLEVTSQSHLRALILRQPRRSLHLRQVVLIAPAGAHSATAFVSSLIGTVEISIAPAGAHSATELYSNGLAHPISIAPAGAHFATFDPYYEWLGIHFNRTCRRSFCDTGAVLMAFTVISIAPAGAHFATFQTT